MDVKADEAGLSPDPFATAIVERPVTDSQGQLFGDAYPTYADTDKIPAVRGNVAAPGPARWLRVLVVLVALVVVAAGAALGLVKAGVIDTNGTSSQDATHATQHHTSTGVSTAPLVTPVSTGNGTATYRVLFSGPGNVSAIFFPLSPVNLQIRESRRKSPIQESVDFDSGERRNAILVICFRDSSCAGGNNAGPPCCPPWPSHDISICSGTSLSAISSRRNGENCAIDPLRFPGRVPESGNFFDKGDKTSLR